MSESQRPRRTSVSPDAVAEHLSKHVLTAQRSQAHTRRVELAFTSVALVLIVTSTGWIQIAIAILYGAVRIWKALPGWWLESRGDLRDVAAPATECGVPWCPTCARAAAASAQLKDLARRGGGEISAVERFDDGASVRHTIAIRPRGVR